MLKWAINEPRQSYFANTPEQLRMFSINELSHISTSSYISESTRRTHLLVQQSIESVCMEPNKKNQVTSTPLLLSPTSSTLSPSVRQTHITTPHLRKLDSFRDLSNIQPENAQQNSTPHRRRSTSAQKVYEKRYASTLPTLDVNEYSPSCALIPGPLLALRGLGIPDAYFEKPRYLTQRENDIVTNTQDDDQITSFATPQTLRKLNISPPKSLSSSQMDDSALDHMIDAIIASSHKDHKVPMKSLRPAHAASRSCSLSPTYTPAFDPASDLDGIWWNPKESHLPSDAVIQSRSSETKTCRNQSSEHTLRTPKSHKLLKHDTTFKRRRQRPVRRKRKLPNFRNTFKKSARKLLSVGSNVSASMPQLYEDDETDTQNIRTDFSPDSGHNSSSGDSSKTEDHNKIKELTNKDANDVEVTKRRLSFSKTHCN